MPEAVRLDFEKLIDYVKDNFSDKDKEMLQKAFELAYNAHEGQKRRSGEPYIIHPLAVAKILAEMGMDAESVCAALL
ncbi:MAG: bifunctional (p)ppGpp synthetase/guanosine-3',5'-bis(diphosphate) 3'-pyrophosphohydrolase, partial [Clostridia bacterium]|nr:bifunctional (p)ppGpp synthetase/guanosine-3',5'-bis(diphosphate) 3'-pyrophosphohydrolase [Clostridia bacterium]